jgi:hypothetical protein
MSELKVSESVVDSDSESNPEGGKQIINAKPSAMVTTTKVRPSEPEELEGRGMPLSLVDVGQGGSDSLHCRQRSQKNLILVEVIKRIEPTNDITPSIATPLAGFVKE